MFCGPHLLIVGTLACAERTIGNAWLQRHGDAIRPVWSRLSLRLLNDKSFASVIHLAAVNPSLVEGRLGLLATNAW